MTSLTAGVTLVAGTAKTRLLDSGTAFRRTWFIVDRVSVAPPIWYVLINAVHTSVTRETKSSGTFPSNVNVALRSTIFGAALTTVGVAHNGVAHFSTAACTATTASADTGPALPAM